jgi:iron(III) transport system ATP-binding protein
MASVQLANITKKFDDVTAVEDLSLKVNDGEFFSLLGPSGCGKTTILRMIAGFYHPTAGEIFFDDRNVSVLPPNKRNTGMVFQNYALFPHMTVFENVAFGLRARKVPGPERRERVRNALELVNLADFESRRVTQLSGGQQQRVALARAIVIEPEILLLDEPLSNLDAKLRRETRDQIQRLQRELGTTTIYVTHDQEEALTLSDRIALMEKGVCQQIGTPHQIYNHPANAFVASFMGRSNIMRGAIVESKTDLQPVLIVDVEGGIQLRISDSELERSGNIILSVRPETIILRKSNEGRVNTFQGEVKLKQFNGFVVEYEVDVRGISFNVIALNEEDRVFDIHEKVHLEIPASKISIIPDL